MVALDSMRQVYDLTVANENIHRPPSRSKAITLLIGSCIAIIAAITVSTGVLVYDFRSRAFADSERELRNTALILGQQVDGSFQALDLVENSIMEHMALSGIASPTAFEAQMADHDLHLMLKNNISGLPHIDALILVNTKGDLINSSRQWPIPKVNISHHAYFTAFAANPRLASTISEPILSQASGTWTIYLARKLKAPDGELLGYVLGAVKLAYFERLFGAIALGEASSISLARADGLLLARYPADQAVAGHIFQRGLAALQDRDDDNATLRLASRIDNTDRLLALQGLTHYPAFISVGTSSEFILADWRAQSKLLLGAGSLFAVVVGLLVILISREVSRSTRASNQMLSQQKLHLNTALSNMSQGLLMTDAAGRVVLCNNRYLEMYAVPAETIRRGCTRREIIEHHFTAGVLSGSVKDYLSEALGKSSEDASFTRAIQTSDGRTIAIINRAIEGGMRVSTHEDVTETRRAEEERDNSRDFLDLVLENVPATIVVKSAHDLRYVLMNRSAELLWGLPREQVIGRTAYDIFERPTADTITILDRQVLDEPSAPILSQQHPIDTPRNGRRTVRTKRLCVRKEHGEPQYLIAVIEDVTDQTTMEEQLRHAHRMESVGSLTGGLAHDFNNLLTVIISNLELLRDNESDTDTAKAMIDTVLQASERGAELTRQLLAFARRQPLQAKPVDVNELVKTTASLLGRVLGKNISIDLRMGDELWTAFADPAQLQTAVVNIAINARDAMPSWGGTLTVETRNVELDAAYASLHAEVVAGKYISIEITDTGCGVTMDNLARIFEPFFTTKPAGQGTGLGLSMVYGFMKQSGGHVSVYSEVDRGTTFKLCLPRFEGVDSASEVSVCGLEPSKEKEGAVILAVDDNDDVRTAVVQQLRALGYIVHEADGAHAAWRLLDEHPKVDLLLTDIIMPGGINGKELASAAKQKYPHLKILFTSGFPGGSLISGAVLDEGDVLLSKPYRKRELADLVDKVLMQ